MAATFPGGVKVFTTKQAGDQIASAHINDLQDEVVAVETELRKTTGSVVRHGSLAGLSNNDHPQYLLAATGKAADSDKLDGIDSTGFVKTSGNQTIAGVKSFSSFPVTPSSAPTTDYQVSNKKYVDDLIGAWASWTPTITWSGGTTDPTSFTVSSARYVTVGNLVFCALRGSLTRGSGDRSYLSLTAPVTISNLASGSAHHGINGTGFVLAPLYSQSGKVTIFTDTMTKDGYIWASWFYEK